MQFLVEWALLSRSMDFREQTMTIQPYTESTADAIDLMMVRQYARYLCLQARHLERSGDHEAAAALRARAAFGMGPGRTLQ